MISVTLDESDQEIKIPESLYENTLKQTFNHVANTVEGLFWFNGKKVGITLPTLKRAIVLAGERGHSTLVHHLEVMLDFAKDKETYTWRISHVSEKQSNRTSAGSRRASFGDADTSAGTTTRKRGTHATGDGGDDERPALFGGDG